MGVKCDFELHQPLRLLVSPDVRDAIAVSYVSSSFEKQSARICLL